MVEPRPSLTITDHGWPPNRMTGPELRRRADRRRRRRIVASTIGTVSVVTLAVTYVPELISPDAPLSPATSRQRDGDGTTRVERFGVSLDLPAGWTFGATETTADRHEICLDDDSGGVSCALVLKVTADPGNSLVQGLNVESHLTPHGCQPRDPNPVQVTQTGAGQLSATRFVARCNQQSEATVVWTLDNRTVMLVSTEPNFASAADDIFATITIPVAWPTPRDSQPSTTPSSSTASTHQGE